VEQRERLKTRELDKRKDTQFKEKATQNGISVEEDLKEGRDARRNYKKH
jgi:hypothetical protein